MSQENVEAFRRALEAANRQDVEALLEELDPEVEWHPMIQALLGGEATVYRGHDGIRELFRDILDAFAESRFELSEIRDLDDQLVAVGRLHTRGKESGIETETPFAYLVHVRDEKAIRIWSYGEPGEAIAAAALREGRGPAS